MREAKDSGKGSNTVPGPASFPDLTTISSTQLSSQLHAQGCSSPLFSHHHGDSNSVCSLLQGGRAKPKKNSRLGDTRSRKQGILKGIWLTVKGGDMTPAPRLSLVMLQPTGALEMAALQASVGGGCLILSRGQCTYLC